MGSPEVFLAQAMFNFEVNQIPSSLYKLVWPTHMYTPNKHGRRRLFLIPAYKAKLFSLQLKNQSKILFRRFLPFTLSFQLCSGPEEVHWDL